MNLVILKKVLKEDLTQFRILETLVQIALFDQNLKVRKTAIEKISKSYQGAIMGGYTRANKIFLTIQYDDFPPVLGYVGDAPKKYRGKIIKQHPFVLRNFNTPTV